MISTAAALEHLFALVSPVGTEEVALTGAAGRVLADDMIATRAQPPFAASAMDGYALRSADARPGASLRVIGEAPAGKAFSGRVGPGEAVRLFTGAPVPEGADRVVIQEDTRATSAGIILGDAIGDRTNIRPLGGDFVPGTRVSAPRRLGPADIALAAAMNLPRLTVRKRPEIALIPTGDELVQPGERPREDQIIASNTLGLKALLDSAGARTRLLPIAGDTEASLRAALELARGADLILTSGGASVGAHDLVGDVTTALGMDRAFYKVAMRPGKPLMAGRIAGTPLIGLPGNPVSSMICGHIFILPVVRVMLGLPAAPPPRTRAPLAAGLVANGPREHYMRAWFDGTAITAFDSQDSSLLSVLQQANTLLVRPPNDPARRASELVEMIALTPH